MPVCTGHFGLGGPVLYPFYLSHPPVPGSADSPDYLGKIVRGGLTEERLAHYHKLMMGVAIQSSAMERRADEAERETVKLKKCEYMEKRTGQVF